MANEFVHYADLLGQIKQRIRQGQTRAVLAANAELISMYWDIGRMLHGRQKREGWGAGVIPRLALDLRNELPEVKGFSERNIKRMLAFYREYSGTSEFVPQPVAQNRVSSEVPQAVGHKYRRRNTPEHPLGAPRPSHGESQRPANPSLVHTANYWTRLEPGCPDVHASEPLPRTAG